LRRLLASERIVTITGPGGAGKTRIAREVANQLRGVVVAWVDLAAVRDPGAVAPAVERALGVMGDGTLTSKQVASALERTPRLIVLDNCEHLAEACTSAVLRLVAVSEQTRVLTTSRVPLRVNAERLWGLPPLSRPGARATVGQAMRTDAVRLFMDRAVGAAPTFALTEQRLPMVLELCERAAGLPLAIELAAARLRHLSLSDLVRLHPRHQLPALGSSSDARYRTLGGAIDWSHQLLTESERETFRRLAVFDGDFSLEAAEAVCSAVGSVGDPATALTSLVDASLVDFSSSTGRYRLLEPIREFAEQRLSESREEERTTAASAAYFVKLATVERDPERSSTEGDRLRREFANVTVVVPWLIKTDPSGALRLLARFAAFRWTAIPVHLSVVSAWLQRAIDAYPTSDALRARALLLRAVLDREVYDDPEHTADLRRAIDDALGVAERVGDRELEIAARYSSGSVAMQEGRPEAALGVYSALLPELPPRGRAMALSVRCVLKQMLGDADGAQQDVASALAAWQEHDPTSPERFLTRLCSADVAYRLGDLERAAADLNEAIAWQDATELQSPAPFEMLAHISADRGDHRRALKLAAYAEHLYTETGQWPSAFLALTDRTWLERAQRSLGADAPRVHSAGWRMLAEDARALARGEGSSSELTRRETTIAGFVAAGLTDREIARRLVISERTIENHVRHIREKLGLRSRAQVGAWLATHVGEK